MRDKGLQTPAGTDVRVIARAFDILDLFQAGAPALSLMEIVHATGLSKATAYRLLSTLTADDILRQRPDGAYELGFFSVHRANAYLSSNSLVRRFKEAMASLSRTLCETVILSERKGDLITDVDVIAAPSAVVSVPPTGTSSLLHLRLPGRAVLAAGTESERQAYAARNRLKSINGASADDGCEFGVARTISDGCGDVAGVIWISVPTAKDIDSERFSGSLDLAIRQSG
ncbi:MAG: helix-turn-helix domain-containing protein [Beijerinckiaceae bacterium]|nr:helix-turn-helix domain-containing protein [Beijerinckiaceae bacterium]